MVAPDELNYSGLVPPSVRRELNPIIGAAMRALSRETVESTVCELVMVIARRLYREAVSEPVWSAGDYRRTVDDVIDQLIDKSYGRVYAAYRIRVFHAARRPDWPLPPPIARLDAHGNVIPPPPTFEAFQKRVRSALEQSPAGAHYQELVQRLETAQPQPSLSDPPSTLVSIKNAAKQLEVSEDTIRRNQRGEYEIVRVSKRRLCVTQRSIDRVKASARWQFNKR